MTEIRFELRRSMRADIDLINQWWDEPVEMVATDISPGGLFVESDFLLEVGDKVVACFHLPGIDEELQMFGDVVWVSLPRRASDNGNGGMGIKFVNTKPLERLKIRQSIRGLPPPLPSKSFATHSC